MIDDSFLMTWVLACLTAVITQRPDRPLGKQDWDDVRACRDALAKAMADNV